jgi:peroxiredoxin
MNRRFYLGLLSTVTLLGGFVATDALSNCHAADLEIGAKAPDFKAKGVDGKEISLAQAKGAKATVIAFTCNRCPVAIAYEDRFIDFQKKYAGKDVKFIAINVNSSEDLQAMKQRVEEKGINYPYAYDQSGDSARAFGARVTPHVFVLDGEGKLAYQGSFDDKQDGPTKAHVENAVKALMEGKQPEVKSTRPFGCGIRPNKG